MEQLWLSSLFSSVQGAWLCRHLAQTEARGMAASGAHVKPCCVYVWAKRCHSQLARPLNLLLSPSSHQIANPQRPSKRQQTSGQVAKCTHKTSVDLDALMWA